MLDRHRGSISECNSVRGVPATKHAIDAVACACTRIPMTTNMDDLECPSILDYVLAGRGMPLTHVVDWRLSLSDHAAVITTVPWMEKPLDSRRRTTWQPEDWEIVDMSASMLPVHEIKHDTPVVAGMKWQQWAEELVNTTQTKKPSAERRQDRVSCNRKSWGDKAKTLRMLAK